MKWTGLNELREMYLHFFEEKGHLRLPSFPLVPNNDPSLLLINSGMAPMKKYFLGEVTPPSKRVVTCQKCIRTPDIENVGKTSRHGTFFEMLGNFSFGDYFKEEATAWAWEFFTDVLAIPREKLYISVYTEDDEAYDIWTKQVGIDPKNMIRLGKEDNFWEHGSGPCGPSSEIYFDRGEENGCGSPDCAPGCDCDRYVEIWNLVFTQYDSDGNGNYTPLEKPNIDTGMGIERLACTMQGVGNLFEVDTIQNVLKHVAKTAGVTYGDNEKTDISLRVVTDHIRSTVFMIADGVLPSNEGRGYVLRRLLRRAARHGRLLGINREFLYEICETVIQESGGAYPELVDNKDYIIRTVRAEEERFGRTITQGMEMLSNLIEKMESKGQKLQDRILAGEDAFRLYDTFGFPIDLIREIIEERSIRIDEDGFKRLMEEQRKRAREARAKMNDTSWVSEVLPQGDTETEFVGYTDLECSAVVIDMVAEGKLAETVNEGESCTVVLDRTPFYAESGGQVGDSGTLVSENGGLMEIEDCKKADTGVYLHTGYVKAGAFTKGDKVTAAVDKERRRAIMRNHTAAHMLQAALREVLGDHIHQAGSYVDDKRVRFDFSHFQAMTGEELRKVERIVNEKILEGLSVSVRELPVDEAKKEGALALFGEKYGDIVRVVKVEDFSTELCGGTHVDNSAKLGLFRILSEMSVAAGVRRIEGTTGLGVLAQLDYTEDLLAKGAREMKLQNPHEILEKIHAFMQEAREKNKEIEALNQRLAQGMVDSLENKAMDLNGITYISTSIQDGNIDFLRTACDRFRDKIPNVVVVIANTGGEKGTLMTACGKEAVAKGVHAGKLVKEVASMAGGSGGGKPDSAMAGFKDVGAIGSALEKVPELIAKMVK